MEPFIDAMPRADLDAPRKQRCTVDRITFRRTLIQNGPDSYRCQAPRTNIVA